MPWEDLPKEMIQHKIILTTKINPATGYPGEFTVTEIIKTQKHDINAHDPVYGHTVDIDYTEKSISRTFELSTKGLITWITLKSETSRNDTKWTRRRLMLKANGVSRIDLYSNPIQSAEYHFGGYKGSDLYQYFTAQENQKVMSGEPTALLFNRQLSHISQGGSYLGITGLIPNPASEVTGGLLSIVGFIGQALQDFHPDAHFSTRSQLIYQNERNIPYP